MADEQPKPWKIVFDVEGQNPDAASLAKNAKTGKNEGGFVVKLVHTGSAADQEVTRVAFERKNSLYPDVSFGDQVQAEVEKARTAVELLNEQLVGVGELH